MNVTQTIMDFRKFALLALWVLSSPVVRAQVDSLNVRLIGRWSMPGVGYNDVWGYADYSGREYAIIGTTRGTAIVEITDSTNVHLIDFIPGAESLWRDIDTWQHYAYVTTEAVGVGIQIIDLSGLPDSAKLVGVYKSTIANAHTLFIDKGGFAYICGAWRFPSTSGGGLNILDLSNPVSPVEVGTYSVAYIHDVYVRNDTAFGAGLNLGVHIIDVSNKSGPRLINRFTYPSPNTHNTWSTESGSYLLTTDEYAGGHLRIFDVRDPFNVNFVGEFTANPNGIIHNVYVLGDLAFMSYYTEGMRIANISDPRFPFEVGFYDTSPATPPAFAGQWSVYPYFPSRKIAASDIQTGLYVFRTLGDLGAQPGRVEGTVTESQTGNPVTDVLVQVSEFGRTTLTDADGRYVVVGLPGPITLIFRKKNNHLGFYPATLQLMLESGVTLDGSVALTPLPSGGVRGRITWSGFGTPLEGVQVVVQGTPLLAVTDADGGYSIPLLLADTTYILSTHKFGFQSELREVSIIASQQTIEDFTLLRGISDDMEQDFQWAIGSPQDNASDGRWERAVPRGVRLPVGGTQVQPDSDHTPVGEFALVTGASNRTSNNPDGRTTVTSPEFDVTDFADPVINYFRWFYTNEPGADTLLVELSSDGGTSWTLLEGVFQAENQWRHHYFRVSDFAPPSMTMKVRFVAIDSGWPSLVDALVDDFSVSDGITSVRPGGSSVPTVYRLEQNYPNPFNPMTTIRYELPRLSNVSLTVYNLLGQEVVELVKRQQEPGSYTVEFYADKLASGLYIYRLEALTEGLSGADHGQAPARLFIATKKMVLIK